jgi:LacI family transcriptional regulator
MSYKEITIYDIADFLKISPATVSRGLQDHQGINPGTKKKIIDTAKKMGYRQNKFASNLRKKSTNTIGVIVPRLNSYFVSTVIAGIEKVANTNNYNLIITQSLENFQKEISNVSTMFNNRVDGVLISLASDSKGSRHFNELLKKGIPLIFFDRTMNLADCTKIELDNKKAGFDATKHLIAQGCRRIAHIEGDTRRNVYADRLAGYRLALKEHGFEFDPNLVISNSLVEYAGADGINQVLKMKKMPDGIFAANDASGVACIKGLKAAGYKVPQDIAVVGFNNDPIATVIDPNLSTINYPGLEMGEIAATTLINKLKKNSSGNLETIVMKHQLVVRESSLKKG